MEDNNNVDMLTPNGAPNGSRWNPTKEQINLLESLYNQGIRTPTAEQIQQITGMLRAFGHIEGKNVFYWFQNHKARQRQKQKQENLAFFNHFHYPYPHPSHHLYLQHCPNIIYRPYYVPPQGDLGFYAKSPGLFLSAGTTAGYNRKSPRMDKMHKAVPSTSTTGDEESNTANAKKCSPETLDLFPLLPTGILQASKSVNGVSDDTPSSGSLEINCCGDDRRGGAAGDHHFFDFFCGNGHYETH